VATFGEVLRGLRQSAGLSQSQLADAAGVGLPTVKDYEGDRRSPSLEIAQKMAGALGVKVTAFDGVEFKHVAQRPSGQDRPTAPPPRRTGRKMPGKPKHRGGGAGGRA
jgi:transcriptional regulator with XRE-family HTH domain